MAKDMVDLPVIGRAAEVRADTIDMAQRRIEIVWTTGATVQRARWEGWDDRIEYDEELEVSPGAVRLERLNAGAPFLDTHCAYELESVLGSVVPGSARIEGGRGYATIQLTIAEDAAGAVARILDGSVRNVSVGYRVHKYEITKSDGQREHWRAVDWEPLEISAVAIPADPGAQVRGERPGRAPAPCALVRVDPAASAATMERTMTDTTTVPAGQNQTAALAGGASPQPQVDAEAVRAAAVEAERQRAAAIRSLGARHGLTTEADDMVARGVTLEAARAEVLEVLATRSAAGSPRTEPVIAGSRLDETETRRLAMEEAVLAHIERRQPAEFARLFFGRSLVALAAARLGLREVPESNGGRVDVLLRAHSTSDFPALFENVLNKGLANRYQTAQPTYRRIARQRTYMDLRPHPTIRPGDFPKLQAVSAENGEIKAGTFLESKESTSAAPYAVQIGLSMQMLINDSLNGLQQVIDDQGPAVARWEDETFYTTILGAASSTGPTLNDTGRAMFNTTDLTLAASGTAITTASIGAGRAVMLAQTSKGGQKLSIMPAILLCGPAKITEAETVLTTVQAAQASQVNLFAGRIEPIVSPWISGNRWYLFADPAIVPNFEWGLLDGFSAPVMRRDEPFGIMGVRMSVAHFWGGGGIDFRGGYNNPGA